jgi:2-polyprenyl-6-methoxyphenol hydroxylase-like FAD-dependent oxidoreductase
VRAGFEEDEDGVTVYFKGRVETVRAKLLIGVDGLFSNVRKAVMPLHEQGGDEVCESGHTNWNAIMHPGDAGLPYPHPVVSLTYQKADPPRFFFLIECGHGRVLWQVRVDDPAKDYTVASKKGHGRLGVGGVKARILELVEDVPDVRPYIEATPEEGIYERCLLFRKMLQRYSSPGRRVALVGDAAHGMHSVRGQGANMTFEDAHLLELALGKFGVGPSAIRAYEHSRIPRANMVQYESNTYYKRQFEKNTSHEWKLKVRGRPEHAVPGDAAADCVGLSGLIRLVCGATLVLTPHAQFLNFQSYAKGELMDPPNRSRSSPSRWLTPCPRLMYAVYPGFEPSLLPPGYGGYVPSVL